MEKIKKILYISILCVLINACNFHSDKTALALTDPTNTNRTSLSSFDALKLNILDPKCLRCHGAAGDGGVDLSTYSSIISNPRLVTAGNLQQSRLYTEVFTGSMPEGGPVLSADEVAAIANWIQSGAPDGDFSPGAPMPDPTLPPIPSSSIYKQIQTKLFDPSCVRCHSTAKPSGKVDLSSYQKLMANKKIVIVPGKPERSLAFTEIANGSMPPRGGAVDSKLAELLKKWITEGANENN